jgi:hypothetical protein
MPRQTHTESAGAFLHVGRPPTRLDSKDSQGASYGRGGASWRAGLLGGDTVSVSASLGRTTAYFGANLSPAPLGVGYIVGLNIRRSRYHGQTSLSGSALGTAAPPFRAARTASPLLHNAELADNDWEQRRCRGELESWDTSELAGLTPPTAKGQPPLLLGRCRSATIKDVAVELNLDSRP